MKKTVFLIMLLVLVPASVSWALGADEIIEKSNLAHYYAGDDARARIKMTITDRRGRVRSREMTMLRKDIEDNGRQKYFVYFTKPADLSRMVFMVWKQAGGDDDRWLYLPAMDLVRRIASSDKRSSFAGGAFTYEDVSGRRTSDDRHELLGEEEYKGRPVYVIKNVPVDPGLVEFAYYVARIDKENFLPLKAEYFDSGDRLYRVVEAALTGAVNGIPTVLTAMAENLDKGLKTTVEFKDVKYNVGIKESIFKERYLRRPPREVRK